MIAIKDMKEIPSGCDRCRLYPVCKHRDVYNDNYKPTDCPLVEIVTCKDCKYCYENSCDFDGWGVNDDYFCAKGERRK